MNLALIDPASVSDLATGRAEDLFAEDVRRSDAALRERIGGRRVLAIGGAGSIGAATVRALLAHRPHALHVVDLSENNLAELVRDLRSGAVPLTVPDFRALPLDYGAPVMAAFFRDAGPFDLVLNFAALKHVRSEKDVHSLIQLLDTNLVKQARFLRLLAETGFRGRYFCVSTDKAADSASVMGASKRLMEHYLFSGVVAGGLRADVTSARFANVAFSDGSLLHGFLKRLAKRQPLAVPRETRRFFVSLREAGELCLLAAAVAPAGHIVVPRLDATRDLKDLEAIAAALLDHVGLRAHRYEDEGSARAGLERDLASGAYPLLVTPRDTSGEKPAEKFVGTGERAVDIGLGELAGVPYVACDAGRLSAFVARLEAVVAGRERPRKEDLVSWMGGVLPNFHHVETHKSLDDRM